MPTLELVLLSSLLLSPVGRSAIIAEAAAVHMWVLRGSACDISILGHTWTLCIVRYAFAGECK